MVGRLGGGSKNLVRLHRFIGRYAGIQVTYVHR